ncbi:MAG TPA: MerR family transcriptional regulator [Polyangiales bacterium]|nr:MerR family transcriptional regulator [Polyangiales bacterium]
MFKIGEFSRIARVSMRLLRYYDELGLLRPAHTDTSNGYRYYTAAQLTDLNRILVLRDLGFPLEQIARLLSEGVSNEELRGMLLMRRAEIEQAQAEQALRLRFLESRIAALESNTEDIPDDVVIRSEPERRYLSLRTRHASFASAVALVLELQREVPRQLGRGVTGTLLGVSHSPDFEPDDLDLELGYALHAEPDRLPVLSGERRLELRTLPGHARVATCVRVGSPLAAHLTTSRIARYLEASGYRMAGPNREIFLQPPRNAEFEGAVIEMAFPIDP